jgi:hypothetical protein
VPKELVIDGQQRLTALVATMRGVAVKDQTFSERRIRIAYDPVSREFHTWDAAIGKDPRYIPDVSAVFEAKRNNQLSKFQRAYVKGYNAALERRGEPPLGDDQEVSVEDGLNELLSLETTYVMPILSISNKVDEEQMSQIFIRVNSGETKLNEDDFIMTLLSVYEPMTRQRIEDWCEASHGPGVGTSYNALLTVKQSHVCLSCALRCWPRSSIQRTSSGCWTAATTSQTSTTLTLWTTLRRCRSSFSLLA